MSKTTWIVIGVLAVIIVLIIYFVYKNNTTATATNTGTASVPPVPQSNVPTICPDGVTPITNTPCPSLCPDGVNYQQNLNNCPPVPPKAGDSMYTNPNYPSNNIYIYSYPIADPNGTYIVGITHRDWAGSNPIGIFVENVANTVFTKITVNNLQIYNNANQLTNITGNFYVNSTTIQNVPI